MAYLQSITMLKIIGVIWLGSVSWLRHTSCPHAASRRPGLSKNWTPAWLSATAPGSSLPMSISRMSRADDQRPSCRRYSQGEY